MLGFKYHKIGIIFRCVIDDNDTEGYAYDNLACIHPVGYMTMAGVYFSSWIVS